MSAHDLILAGLLIWASPVVWLGANYGVWQLERRALARRARA